MTEDADGRIGNTRGEFSVCQFFQGGQYEYVRRWVSAEEAGYAFKHYTSNVASRMGMTERVIITDGGDCTNAEWKYGEGVVYPPPKKQD
jgi:hypothetical protein